MTWEEFKTWGFYIAYASDLWLNALMRGSPRETVSSRCYRLNHIPAYRCAELVINAAAYLFDGPDHCKQSYLNIANGTYLPWEFFEKAQQEALAMNAEFDMRLAA